MNTEEPIQNPVWDRTAEAHRHETEGRDSSAPFGFASRVVARYRELRQNELFRAWERLSIRTAIGCSCVAVAFVVWSQFRVEAESDADLVELPAMVQTVEDLGL